MKRILMGILVSGLIIGISDFVQAKCTKIQDGVLVSSSGDVLTTGYENGLRIIKHTCLTARIATLIKMQVGASPTKTMN